MELIERVVQITEQEGADIYWGRGASYGSDVTAFCELLRQAITQCRQDAESAGSDLSSGTYQIFVRRTVPRAIEILCKRATKMCAPLYIVSAIRRNLYCTLCCFIVSTSVPCWVRWKRLWSGRRRLLYRGWMKFAPRVTSLSWAAVISVLYLPKSWEAVGVRRL